MTRLTQSELEALRATIRHASTADGAARHSLSVCLRCGSEPLKAGFIVCESCFDTAPWRADGEREGDDEARAFGVDLDYAVGEQAIEGGREP